MLVVVRGDYETQDESFKGMDEIFSKFGEKSVEEGGILERMRKRKSRGKKIPEPLYKIQNTTNPSLSLSLHFNLYKDFRFLVLPWKLYILNTFIPAVIVSNPILFVQNQG